MAERKMREGRPCPDCHPCEECGNMVHAVGHESLHKPECSKRGGMKVREALAFIATYELGDERAAPGVLKVWQRIARRALEEDPPKPVKEEPLILGTVTRADGERVNVEAPCSEAEVCGKILFIAKHGTSPTCKRPPHDGPCAPGPPECTCPCALCSTFVAHCHNSEGCG